jgi:hypothetical protein
MARHNATIVDAFHWRDATSRSNETELQIATASKVPKTPAVTTGETVRSVT